MPANFRFITHATQTHAHKLASGGLGDGFTQRCLAHARGANQTEHRAFQLFNPLLYCQKFQDSLFDLFQTMVVLIQRLFSIDQIVFYSAAVLPWHADHPVYVVAQH